ncbi:hypothetical protein COM59_28995 [Bacillus pseudomycoides]|uniref:hypothetical protein n=1 Tax=Bacillus pseudomycoides TaxID=64104 RepID=UPI000BF57875|nr:hypothetical protein [Bacillus pseudomycoides]PGF05621.1 hypothetical protein COM59_28995 [Bacillus pseudomycoides]
MCKQLNMKKRNEMQKRKMKGNDSLRFKLYIRIGKVLEIYFVKKENQSILHEVLLVIFKVVLWVLWN